VAPRPIARPTCAPAQTACPSATGDLACVDTSADDAHCGTCDHACAATERCVASACVAACTTASDWKDALTLVKDSGGANYPVLLPADDGGVVAISGHDDYTVATSRTFIDLVHYDAAGNRVWTLHDPGLNGARSARDGAGNLYVAGGLADDTMAVRKYTADGARAWTGSAPGETLGRSGWGGVTVDSGGRAYLIAPSSDVVKFDVDGHVAWTHAAAGATVNPRAAVDGAGNLALITSGTSVAPAPCAVVLIDANGTVAWTRTVGSKDGWNPSCAEVAALDSDVLVAGEQDGRPGVTHYDSAGTVVWRASLTGAGAVIHFAIDASGHGFGCTSDSAAFEVAPTGEVLWQTAWDPSQGACDAIAIDDPEGGAFVVTDASSKASLLHFDAHGRVSASVTFDFPGGGLALAAQRGRAFVSYLGEPGITLDTAAYDATCK
jgi:hypothetical protein